MEETVFAPILFKQPRETQYSLNRIIILICIFAGKEYTYSEKRNDVETQ